MLKSSKYMKKLFFLLLILQISCKSRTYTFVESKTAYGVDFTKGKWLLNELEVDKENKDRITDITSRFFSKKLDNRFSYIKNEKGMLMAQKSYFKSSKSLLLDLKKGTGFDFLINVVATRNKADMAGLQLYQTEVAGTNASEVFLEIVDLNTQEVVFFEHVIGKFQKNTKKSMWENSNILRSTNVIKNINLNITSNKLLRVSLEKILKKLDN